MTSGSKVMAQIVVFLFSVTLTLTFDLFSIVCHTHCAWCTGISMRSFIRIRPVILGDMPWTHTHTHTHIYTHTHTPKVILIVSQNARLITITVSNQENMKLCKPWNCTKVTYWSRFVGTHDNIQTAIEEICKTTPTTLLVVNAFTTNTSWTQVLRFESLILVFCMKTVNCLLIAALLDRC